MGTFELYDLRITVVEIQGRSVCGLAVGDCFELTESSRLRIPDGKHFCLYALQSVLPFLAAHQRTLDPADWMSQDTIIACPDPEERLLMKIERIAKRRLNTDDLTRKDTDQPCKKQASPSRPIKRRRNIAPWPRWWTAMAST